MNRKYSTIIISMLLLLTSLLIVMPQGCADPAIMITNYTLSPEILMPGDTALLTLTIANGETTSTRSVVDTTGGSTTTTTKTVGARIEKIWIVQSGTNQIRATSSYEDVGYLAPGMSIDISFKLKAHNNITEGMYFPTVRIDVASYTDVQYPLSVKVSNKTVDLISTSVPSKISMSGSSEITLTAVNRRGSSVDGVIVTPRVVDTVEVIPESVFVDTLEGFASEEVSFSIKPSETGMKNLSFDVSYMNGDNLHTETLVLSMEVVETLDVGSIFTSVPLKVKKGSSTRVSLEVFNAKTESITGVIVTPMTDAVVIPSEYFIGAMDADDVFAASFDLYTDTFEYGNHTIRFKVTFKQGSEYYETPVVSHTFSVVAGEGSSYQPSSGSGSNIPANPAAGMLETCVIVIAVIIILIAVFLVWRWKKKRSAE